MLTIENDWGIAVRDLKAYLKDHYYKFDLFMNGRTVAIHEGEAYCPERDVEAFCKSVYILYQPCKRLNQPKVTAELAKLGEGYRADTYCTAYHPPEAVAIHCPDGSTLFAKSQQDADKLCELLNK